MLNEDWFLRTYRCCRRVLALKKTVVVSLSILLVYYTCLSKLYVRYYHKV